MAAGFADSKWTYFSIVVFSLILFGQDSRGLSQAPGGREPNLTFAQRKITPVIRTTVAQMMGAGINSSNAASLNAAQRYSGPLLKVDNKFRMQLYLDLTELNARRLATLAAISEIEIEIVNEGLKRIQAWVPCEKIEALAALDFVVWVRLPEYATIRTGSKNSEGDTILKADQVRSTLGITGAGVRVGVISDGANNIADAQARGDLPASITIFGSCNPAVTGTTCNEGTAMLEIIHDLAPGATLAMGDESTSLEFIQRVTDLRTWGAKVIVDDDGFFNQPYFEDGTVAAAYSAALAQGIVMVSAAGNDAQTHYQAQFVANDSSSHPPHNFGGVRSPCTSRLRLDL